MPSPNMPTLDAAHSLSRHGTFRRHTGFEGRGTTNLSGSSARRISIPMLMRMRLSPCAARRHVQGLRVSNRRFKTREGSSCGGVQIHVVDRERFDSVLTGVAMVKVAMTCTRTNFVEGTAVRIRIRQEPIRRNQRHEQDPRSDRTGDRSRHDQRWMGTAAREFENCASRTCCIVKV